MTEEQLSKFLQLVASDANLKSRLEKALDAESVSQLAAEAGITIPAETLANITKTDSSNISEKELESVSGGTVGDIVDTAIKLNNEAPTIAVGLCLMKKGASYIDGFLNG